MLLSNRSGRGLWDTVKSLPGRVTQAIRGRREGAPPDVRQYLATHSDTAIRAINIFREPISSGVRTALDAITFGGFSAAARRLNYDNVFHLYIVLDTEDGSVRFDKNEVVRIKRSPSVAGDHLPVPLRGPLTVGKLFDNGIAQNPSHFWLYDSINNCQNFVMSLLRGSGLDTPANTRFVLQDAASLLSGFAKKAADAVTDLAGRADVLVHGVGCGCRACRRAFGQRARLRK